jgi:hypothetical protein
VVHKTELISPSPVVDTSPILPSWCFALLGVAAKDVKLGRGHIRGVPGTHTNRRC